MDIIKHLNRLDIKQMKIWELDAGFALASGLTTRVTEYEGSPRKVEVHQDGEWRHFSPTTSWEDFGSIIGKLNIVMGVHGDDEDDRWFSAHAFLNGTSFDSREDMRIVAARAATAYGRLLDWEMAAENEGKPCSSSHSNA